MLIFSAISTIIMDFEGMWDNALYGEITTEPIDYVRSIGISIASGFLVTGLMLWVARKIYKVETTYKRIFSTFQFARLPFSILTIPIGIVLGIYLTTLTQQPGLESAYGVVGITWGTLSPIIIHLVILTILAAKQSFQLTTLQVIAVWIISTVVIISIFIPIGIVLGVLGAFNVF